MVVEKDRLIGLLDKFIDRSNRHIADAKEREDDVDLQYYEGQKDVIGELKDMVQYWS